MPLLPAWVPLPAVPAPDAALPPVPDAGFSPSSPPLPAGMVLSERVSPAQPTKPNVTKAATASGKGE
jgi:hypothetical protein